MKSRTSVRDLGAIGYFDEVLERMQNDACQSGSIAFFICVVLCIFSVCNAENLKCS